MLVILVPSLSVGGTERQVCVLVNGIVTAQPSMRQEVVVVTLRGGGALERDVRDGGVVVVSPQPRGPVPGLRSILGLIRVLRDHRPTVVYSLLTPANVLAALVRPVSGRYRLVWGVRSQTGSMGRARWRRVAVEWAVRLCAVGVERVVVNGDAVAEYVCSLGVRRDRIVVIPNGIDTSRFAPDAWTRALVRSELDVADDAVLVVSLARFVPEKDHETLLRALALFVASGPVTMAFLAGDDPLGALPALQRLSVDLGLAEVVRFSPPRNDVEAIMNAADVLVLSSVSEGMPNVVLEALACGTPVVSTDAGDVRSVLPPDRVVAVRDPQALARTMLAATSSAAGRRASLLADRYAVHSMVEATLQALMLTSDAPE